jgi:toxin-antitoxin system PIN domain toxin
MTSFFPDVNVWIALSVIGHSHNWAAWQWLEHVPRETSLIFSHYTQVGLLRLLTNQAAMGEETLTLDRAWSVYDGWLNDLRVELHPEPRDLDAAFRNATAPFAVQRASKWIGDCYLLAFAKEAGATLVTFDKALLSLARKCRYVAIIPAET